MVDTTSTIASGLVYADRISHLHGPRPTSTRPVGSNWGPKLCEHEARITRATRRPQASQVSQGSWIQKWGSTKLARTAVTGQIRQYVQLRLVPMHSKDSIILALRVTTLLDASLLPFRARVVFRVGQVKGIPTVRSTNRQHVRVPVHTLTVQNRALQVR